MYEALDKKDNKIENQKENTHSSNPPVMNSMPVRQAMQDVRYDYVADRHTGMTGAGRGVIQYCGDKAKKPKQPEAAPKQKVISQPVKTPQSGETSQGNNGKRADLPRSVPNLPDDMKRHHIIPEPVLRLFWRRLQEDAKKDEKKAESFTILRNKIFEIYGKRDRKLIEKEVHQIAQANVEREYDDALSNQRVKELEDEIIQKATVAKNQIEQKEGDSKEALEYLYQTALKLGHAGVISMINGAKGTEDSQVVQLALVTVINAVEEAQKVLKTKMDQTTQGAALFLREQMARADEVAFAVKTALTDQNPKVAQAANDIKNFLDCNSFQGIPAALELIDKEACAVGDYQMDQTVKLAIDNLQRGDIKATEDVLNALHVQSVQTREVDQVILESQKIQTAIMYRDNKTIQSGLSALDKLTAQAQITGHVQSTLVAKTSQDVNRRADLVRRYQATSDKRGLDSLAREDSMLITRRDYDEESVVNACVTNLRDYDEKMKAFEKKNQEEWKKKQESLSSKDLDDTTKAKIQKELNDEKENYEAIKNKEAEEMFVWMPGNIIIGIANRSDDPANKNPEEWPLDKPALKVAASQRGINETNIIQLYDFMKTYAQNGSWEDDNYITKLLTYMNSSSYIIAKQSDFQKQPPVTYIGDLQLRSNIGENQKDTYMKLTLQILQYEADIEENEKAIKEIQENLIQYNNRRLELKQQPQSLENEGTDGNDVVNCEGNQREDELSQLEKNIAALQGKCKTLMQKSGSIKNKLKAKKKYMEKLSNEGL